MPAPQQEVLVCSLFDDGSLVEHQNLVEVSRGCQSVGDHHDGPVVGQLHQGVVDRCLRDRVEHGGGFVEQKDRRVADKSARDGDTLPLAAG